MRLSSSHHQFKFTQQSHPSTVVGVFTVLSTQQQYLAPTSVALNIRATTRRHGRREAVTPEVLHGLPATRSGATPRGSCGRPPSAPASAAQWASLTAQHRAREVASSGVQWNLSPKRVFSLARRCGHLGSIWHRFGWCKFQC